MLYLKGKCVVFLLFLSEPDDIHNVVVSHPEHNVIKVTCDYKNKKVYGPKKEFIARLYNNNGTVKTQGLKSKKCEFEFSELSYSTTYTLEVCVTIFFFQLNTSYFFKYSS